MGMGRFPGVAGMGPWRGCIYIHGPMDAVWLLHPDRYGWVDEWHSTPGLLGVGGDLSAASADAAKASAQRDEDELKLLTRIYGNLRNRAGNKTYAYGKKKMNYRTADYISDRNGYFGSEKAYLEHKQKAREELEADGAKLRKYIEPAWGVRKKHADWKEAQDVFYAWVRRGFKKQLGDDADIPKLIRAQMSDKLKTALQQVRLDYGKSFQAGGFNPRPMKLAGSYRLGTLSEHALGTAIDIDASGNAQITSATWALILKYTGKSLDQETRKAKWKAKPRELHTEIKAINDDFVSKLQKGMQDAVAATKKLAEGAGAGKGGKQAYAEALKNPLAAAMAADENLNKIGLSFLARWQNGFMNLPWELVKELHEEQFLWGATFKDPDLHHFEL